MRHISKRAPLALMAATLALGAVGVSSASAALPEFTGTTFPVSMEGAVSTESSAVEFDNTEESVIGCEGMKVKGEVTGAKSSSLTLEASRCKTEEKISPEACHTPGAAEGVVTISGTAGLNYISKASKTVGLVLPLTGELEVICKHDKRAYDVYLRGAVIIPITPVNTSTTKYSLTLKVKSTLEQEYAKYENEKGELIKAVLELQAYEIPGYWFRGGIAVKQAVSLTANKSFTISA
jgi:hypothetical protein